MITLKELRRIASEPRLAEMIRVDQQMPRNSDDEGRDRFAQLVVTVRSVRKTLKETEPWVVRQAEVESEELRDRYEMAQLEHDQRLDVVAEVFELVGLDQPAPDREGHRGEISSCVGSCCSPRSRSRNDGTKPPGEARRGGKSSRRRTDRSGTGSGRRSRTGDTRRSSWASGLADLRGPLRGEGRDWYRSC